MDKQYFDLTKRNTLMDSIEDKPSERELGGNKSYDKVRMYIGTRPVVVDVKKFIEQSGKGIPKNIELFTSYNIFLLSHSIGVMQEGNLDINQVGYRMEFDDDMQVSVKDLLPQPNFIKRFSGELKVEANLGLNGSLEVPTGLTQMIDKIEWLGAGGKLQASTDNSIAGVLSFSTYTNEILAIGKNSNSSEWLFNNTSFPLYGRDIEMNQVLLVDRFADYLSYKCRAYINISSWLGLNSVRRDTGWINVSCKLK